MAANLFLAQAIRAERFRFLFGRKWHAERMRKTGIWLPSKDGKPDYGIMEAYILGCNFSVVLNCAGMGPSQGMAS